MKAAYIEGGDWSVGIPEAIYEYDLGEWEFHDLYEEESSGLREKIRKALDNLHSVIMGEEGIEHFFLFEDECPACQQPMTILKEEFQFTARGPQSRFDRYRCDNEWCLKNMEDPND